MSFLAVFIAGGSAAAVSKIVAAPLDRVKVLQQTAATLRARKNLPGQDSSAWAIVQYVVQEEGILGLWRGVSLACLRYFPTQALNFACRDMIRNLFRVPRTAPFAVQLAAKMASGAAAGAFSLFFVWPLDAAYTRQLSLVGEKESVLESLARFFGDVMDRGLLYAYRGYGTSVLGILLYRMSYFGLYDATRTMVEKDNFFGRFIVAQFVTMASGIITYPLDTIRRRAIADEISGSEAFSRISDTEGICGFFSGVGANVLRGFVGAFTLVAYDMLRRG